HHPLLFCQLEVHQSPTATVALAMRPSGSSSRQARVFSTRQLANPSSSGASAASPAEATRPPGATYMVIDSDGGSPFADFCLHSVTSCLCRASAGETRPPSHALTGRCARKSIG